MSNGPERRWYVIRRLVVALVAVFTLLGVALQVSAAFPSGAPAAPSGAAAVQAPGQAGVAQPKKGGSGDASVDNFNCADISRMGIDKQLNLRAAAIMTKCGKEDGVPPPLDTGSAAKGAAAGVASAVDKLLSPLA